LKAVSDEIPMVNNRAADVIVMLLLIFALLVPGSAPAAEDTPLDEIISGFDDNGPENSEPDILEGFDDKPVTRESVHPEETETTSVFSLDGYFKLGASYNIGHDAPEAGETDWRGLSRLRAELNLELNARFSRSWQARISGKGAYDCAYAMHGRDEFTPEVIDNYEKEIELGETYIQGSLMKHLDIKFGRQIVVWGKSDNIRVTDVLNPLDRREPGVTDIEDLRLPVTMTRLDYYIGDWSLTGMAIHEIRFNKLPEYGSDFYPGAQPPPHEDKPDSCCSNTEYAAAISGIFSGWDIAFYWADVYDDMPHIRLVSPGLPPQTQWQHARLKMLGAAFNQALGNWLLKAEGAYIDGFEFFNAPGEEYSRTDVLAGVEYSGFHDTTLSMDAVIRHINHFDDALKRSPDNAQENEFQWVVRLTRDFFNETLTTTILISTFGGLGQDGVLQRFSAEYDITDSIQVTGGLALYLSGDMSQYKKIGVNDRLFCEIKYSF